MVSFLSLLTPGELALAFAIATLAGLVKGLVGFAMPMITMSGLSMFLPPDLALAGLILPTVVTNAMQALRQGFRPAFASARRFGLFLGVGFVFLLASAQLVRVLPDSTLLLLIGLPVSVFSLMQLVGVRFSLAAPSRRIEAVVGGIAGFIGGLSGIWGPPTVAYLTALNTPKIEQIRVQGVIYGLGAVALFGAHVGSGVMRVETLPFSMVMVVPAVLGMWIGSNFQDRIDQKTFRRATLLVLAIVGLNLVRRGLMG